MVVQITRFAVLLFSVKAIGMQEHGWPEAHWKYASRELFGGKANSSYY
jgi:hypothetical protein